MTDYATLQSDVANFSARQNLASQIPTFIRLAESKIARKVRVLEMQTNTTLSVPDTGSIALPERFLGFRSVYFATIPPLSGSAELDYVSPDQFHEIDINSTQITGIAQDGLYTIESGNLLLTPKPGQGETTDVNVSYWQRFSTLSDVNTTNWLLTNHFDIYLDITMAELNSFIQDTDMEVLWRTKFQDDVGELHRSERRKQRSGPHIRRARFSP